MKIKPNPKPKAQNKRMSTTKKPAKLSKEQIQQNQLSNQLTTTAGISAKIDELTKLATNLLEQERRISDQLSWFAFGVMSNLAVLVLYFYVFKH
jgi:hypothetical protein